MAKLYGWGAAVVILGALFKINHYTGANAMLIVGLGTEAAIFFFSAFEPPHVEPDWSLVYPELAGMYHGLDVEEQQLRGHETQKLDQMLEEAKIGPDLIDSLGEGLRNLSDNTSNLADISNAGVATNEYVDNIKSASESAGELSESYKRTSESLNQDINASEEYFNNIKEAAQSASSLSNVYAQASESFKADVAVTDEFTESVKNAINSANMLSAKYTESADILSKSVESLDLDAVDGKSYNEQLS
ncbi:MAG: gliding motility protein GldL, partial [Bacteroidales bacterium]|nr:gliding motility protein GldL [Bacteroidales bacterium]